MTNIRPRPSNHPIRHHNQEGDAPSSRLRIPQNPPATYESTHRAPFLATEGTREKLRAASLLASPGQATFARVLDRVLEDDFHNTQARIAAEEHVASILSNAGQEPATQPITLATSSDVRRTGPGVHRASEAGPRHADTSAPRAA